MTVAGRLQALENDKMELQVKVEALESNLEQLLAVKAPASTRLAVDKVVLVRCKHIQPMLIFVSLL